MNRRLPRGVSTFLLVGVILWGAVATIAPNPVQVHFGGTGNAVTAPVWLVGLVSLAACAITAKYSGGSSVAERIWLFPTLSAILAFTLTLVLWQGFFPSAGLITPIVSAATAAVAFGGSGALTRRPTRTRKA